MSLIAPIDAVAESQALLPSQYVNAATLQAYVGALAVTWQSIDDCLQQLQSGLDVDNAQGVQLDNLGALVGQPRLGGQYPTGESDAAYRPKVKARSLANRSEGTTPELQEILSVLIGAQLLGVDVVDAYPAGFYVNLNVASPLTTQQKADVIDFVLASKPAGVRCRGIVNIVDPVFAFDGFPVPPGAGYDVGAWADYFYP